jgi:hypothetical protein
VLAALQAGAREAAGEFAHQHGEGAPGQRLPDAELLLAQRCGAGTRGGVAQQQVGEGGVGHRVSGSVV